MNFKIYKIIEKNTIQIRKKDYSIVILRNQIKIFFKPGLKLATKK